MILYGITLFLSAFLLFLVQPLLGKFILPWFGGTPSVWTTCMLFFQVLLLAGYTYSHALASRCRPRRQGFVHLLVLAAALATLPIIPSETWKPAGDQLPVWRILGLLAVSIGGPYLVLSTASPLLQSWFSRFQPDRSPYRLYSLSNLGSLLAIVGYPFLVEPNIALNLQARLWAWSYAAFTLACACCAMRILRIDRAEPRENPDETPLSENAPVPAAPSVAHRILWLSLPMCSSVVLLATTNQLCLDIAVTPLLWVLPLGLYLLSFILCFHSTRWYSRLVYGVALGAALAQAAYVLHRGVFVPIHWQIASYSLTLFACCMVCHGELVRIKPGFRDLTAFYRTIAGGGVLGGLFVTLVAPAFFNGYWEFHLGMLLTAFLYLLVLFRDRGAPLYHGRPLWAWTLLYCAFSLLIVCLGLHIRSALGGSLEMARNFFGVLRVLEEEKSHPEVHRYTLMHGRIEHGFQYQAEEKRYWPTSYFGPGSGVGIAIRFHPSRKTVTSAPVSMRIGIVGLGTGTLATYGRPQDTIRFYEINPEVVRLSNRYFSYLKDSAAQVEVVLGDARISMEREMRRGQIQQFDILAVDAFSSDAIPVHLLTQECFQIYRSHLKKDGILALHISSRYFDLAPVARGLAALDPKCAIQAIQISGKGNDSQGTDSSDWVLLTENRHFLGSAEVQRATQSWSDNNPPPQLWSDNYSNLFRLMRR